MPLLGDLERFVATSLYPLRVPIAIGVLALIGGLLLVARRRRWDRAVRRHPRIAGAGLVAVLAVGLPVGWYLASPLVIRTELVEPAVAGGQVVVGGEFRGADEFHFGQGTATIVEVAPGRHVLRLAEFSVRNGPDLYVYLAADPDGQVGASDLELGLLKATDGAFEYELPAGVDPSSFGSAVVWCRQFAVLFAHAPLG